MNMACKCLRSHYTSAENKVGDSYSAIWRPNKVSHTGYFYMSSPLPSSLQLAPKEAIARSCRVRSVARRTCLTSRCPGMSVALPTNQLKNIPVLTQFQQLVFCQLHERAYLARGPFKIFNRKRVNRDALNAQL